MKLAKFVFIFLYFFAVSSRGWKSNAANIQYFFGLCKFILTNLSTFLLISINFLSDLRQFNLNALDIPDVHDS